MKYSISVIIPNYNGQDLLKKNLPKVFSALSFHKNSKIEVIVSDDCSTDNSIDALREIRQNLSSSYPSIKLMIAENNRNLGFSSNVNKAVEAAEGEILILLNTDVYPKGNFLEPLLKHFEDEDVFAVGCMDESIENGNTILRGRGVGSWKRGFLVHSRGDVNRANTLWVSGGSSAFRKSIWKKLGGFDRIYNPFYWEDIDLSYRALKSGYRIVFESKSTVIHEHEKGAIKKKFSSSKIKNIAYKNQFVFVWKNVTDFDLRLQHVFWLPYHFLKALSGGDLAFFVGFFLAFLQLPQIVSSRLRTGKYFTKSDRKLIKEMSI